MQQVKLTSPQPATAVKYYLHIDASVFRIQFYNIK